MVAHMVITTVVIILTTILVLMFRALFSRPSSDRSQDSSEHGGSPVPNTSSSPIESSPSSSSPGCFKYDVFLSFRGEDVRKNFVDHLYNALVGRTILTYKDDETLPRGDTIGPALFKAIQESRIALIVFSKNYADSLWCLDELAYIMKCKEERGQIVIPIFYDVDPSDVRKQKGQFGRAFSKHFSANNEKVESWKEALVDSSNIAGWETKFVANGHEAKCIKEIVDSVLDKLQSFNSAVDDDDELVGMVTRLQALKSQLEIGSGGVRMVGIWGVGGGGKTTLATSLYMEISANFSSRCFVENVREESKQHGLKKLQEKILSTVLKKKIEVESVAIGKKDIKHMLCSRKVLVVLDDVDALEQLEALTGRHNWFGYGSRIIITTRDEHVLTTHRVDKVCHVSLLSHDEAIRLFKKHAYHEDNPVEDYDKLSLRVIKYVNGLLLALKIIGSFLNDKDKNGWLDTLDKLKATPNLKVTEQLKISYDGLDPDLKELFLDIACFFRWKSEKAAMKILDACGFHPRIGVTVLKQKSLITISNGAFDMHDLVQEMGHHIVRGKHPDNPETHNRVWRDEDIEDLCAGNATTENHMIEAIHHVCKMTRKDIDDMPAGNSTTENHMGKVMTLVSNLKKLRFLHVNNYDARYEFEGATFLSNDLKYIALFGYSASLFPESFQPRKLVVLNLIRTRQKELWKGKKELEVTYTTALVRTPDISGLSCLQNLIIKDCQSLEEIHQSLGNHTSLVNLHVESCNKLERFPTIVRMEKLEILKISNCNHLLEIPQTSKVHEILPCLKELELTCLAALVRTPDFGGLPCLQKVTFSDCGSLEEIHPSIGSHSSLVYIFVHPMLTRFPTIVRMEKLKILNIWKCNALLEFPNIKGNMDSLENLNLMDLKIEVLPSSVGRYCTNLISLKLHNCSKLKTIEGNFHALKRLEKFKLYGDTQLEKFPKDLFDVKCCLEELRFKVSGELNIFSPSPPHLPHLLRNLNLSSCQLKDGEIPREIGGLWSLIELRLDFNHFSRVDISLSHLTQLKLLSLSYCEMLVELPELPPNLAILKADNCNSLKAIREDIYSVDDELVGMVTRLQDLKSRLEIGSGGVRMVGIWGIGGGGKTTLATSLYMEISDNFNSCCFVDNVREESRQQNGLKKLQGKFLSTVLKKEIEVESVAIGRKNIKHMLSSRNVLVVLDDVDALEQLEALAGHHNWFGYGSRIIITTRDEHVLRAHRVDNACPLILLSDDEAIRLFRKHAYHEDNTVEDYDKLSLRVITYVNGLPLALKIIGSFLNDKDKNEWLDTLDKLRKTPCHKVTDQLKISYDGLEHDEKQMFLDIACFFRGKNEKEAMKILEACGFHPRIGVTVLKKKSLITISKNGEFDMHDLVQEMSHHIVRGKHPNNPETHGRVWRDKNIEEL